MDIFSKNKFLLRLVFVLVFINLFSIGYFWFSNRTEKVPKPPERNVQNVAENLREKLHLTRDQEREFTRIREDFFRKEQELIKQIKVQRDSMNIEMFSVNTDTAKLVKSAKLVAEMEFRMEKYRIEQAQQLKSICTREQLEEFRKLAVEIRDYLQPQEKQDKKPGNRRNDKPPGPEDRDGKRPPRRN